MFSEFITCPICKNTIKFQNEIKGVLTLAVCENISHQSLVYIVKIVHTDEFNLIITESVLTINEKKTFELCNTYDACKGGLSYMILFGNILNQCIIEHRDNLFLFDKEDLDLLFQISILG